MEKMQSTKWLWVWAKIGVLLPLAMAADSTKDDMGDEFSNNLFSDLGKYCFQMVFFIHPY